LPTEPELRLLAPSLREEPDLGFTVLPRDSEPVEFRVREPGLMLLEDPDRLVALDPCDRPLPGRTCWVRSVRPLLWPARRELHTRLPSLVEPVVLTDRWSAA